MSVKDELGIRMKEEYEKPARSYLKRKVPVAIRIDGKAFHTFTRGFEKPFDDVLINSMQLTMKYLCENIQGCVLGYTQSDEITLILIDYQNENTDAWFGYQIQKICSISASMATKEFNKCFPNQVKNFYYNNAGSMLGIGNITNRNSNVLDLYRIYKDAEEHGAMFDSRCFNIPKEEVANLIYWRQVDAIRNSIQMVGQTYFSDKQRDGKSCTDIKEMLLSEKNIDWESFETYKKRGSCCRKEKKIIRIDGSEIIRSRWIIDKEIPIFKGENREYIEKLI